MTETAYPFGARLGSGNAESRKAYEPDRTYTSQSFVLEEWAEGAGYTSDHTETLQIDFDPQIITFEQLLEVFWNNHNPININDYKGRQ